MTIEPIWSEQLQLAARFLLALMDPQGNIPSIGDNDDAWVVRLDDRPNLNNYLSVLATSAGIVEPCPPKNGCPRVGRKEHVAIR